MLAGRGISPAGFVVTTRRRARRGYYAHAGGEAAVSDGFPTQGQSPTAGRSPDPALREANLRRIQP
jgi:hypothetical protein